MPLLVLGSQEGKVQQVATNYFALMVQNHQMMKILGWLLIECMFKDISAFILFSKKNVCSICFANWTGVTFLKQVHVFSY